MSRDFHRITVQIWSVTVSLDLASGGDTSQHLGLIHKDISRIIQRFSVVLSTTHTVEGVVIVHNIAVYINV